MSSSPSATRPAAPLPSLNSTNRTDARSFRWTSHRCGVRGVVQGLRAAELPPVHALVCNAGIQVVSGAEATDNGVEMTFGVNHLGHFALVHGFLDHLARPARIVVVSSGTHDPAKHTGMPEPRYTSAAELARPDDCGTAEDGRRAYTTSKLCNLLFSYELDRRLGHGEQGVTVNAFDPGLMPGSGLARDYPPLQRLAWRYQQDQLNQ